MTSVAVEKRALALRGPNVLAKLLVRGGVGSRNHTFALRTLHLWEPIVLYRQTSGALSAFEDCCPHRLLPLSKGFLQGEQLICKYHGLRFNESGRCVWMPGQEGIHAATKLRVYPAAEKHRFVWVWIGDPALADEKTIPDLSWCSDPNWVFEGSTYYLR